MSRGAAPAEDTEVVDLEKMLAGDVACTVPGCTETAVWSVWCMSRCGNGATLCRQHYSAKRDEHPADALVGCPRCGRTGSFSLLFNSRML